MEFEELENERERFQVLVNRFGLNVEGANPFDARKLDASFVGASHGEKCAIQFLLSVWSPREPWGCGKFDMVDAASVWNDDMRRACAEWLLNPFWP